MSGAANNPNLERVRLLSSEITSIEIYSDQTNDKYYVGEDVTITAKFNKPFKVLCVKWQFNGNSLRNTIDTELPKYAGTRYENNKHLLVIKNCCALDAGEYFLVATCKQEEDIYSKDVGICRDSVDICSNKLHLKVGQGSPQVTLNEEHSAVFNKCAKITAAIRSYPKHNSVKWKKGEDPIDITLPKYAGSLVDGDSPVLCINNVEEEDGADYTIEVQNEMGKAIGSRTVQVLGDCPKVTLNEEHSAVFNKCAKITAAITSFPKHNSVIWKKGEDPIDTTLPKYAGSSVDGDSPVLCITDVEEKDSDDYTIEVQNEMGKAICSRKIEVIGAPPEVTLNEGIAAVFHKYTEIIATIRSFPKHSSVIWKKGEDIIDITLPKYAGSLFDGNHLILYIANVEKEDEDVYTIEVQNEKGIATCSRKVVVLGGRPEIELNNVPSTVFNDCVEFKATIQSFPKHTSVIWMKGENAIDITLLKYAGSSIVGDCPVLYINNIKEEDGGDYTIKVQNEKGIETCSRKLVVIGVQQMIFISGPVVVSPSDKIILHTFMLEQNYANAKWWKIKNRLTTEIKIDDKKYFTYQNTKKPFIEIQEANQEDSAAYQFSLGDMKSNIINIFVDDSGKFSTSKEGNCLRLFQLQAVSAAALRETFENEADFEEKKTKLLENWKMHKKNRATSLTPSQVQEYERTTLKNADISFMYSILRNSVVPKPKNGWGNYPQDNNIELADDIERIRHYRNIICHTDATRMETTKFNESVLDLVGAIRRLSKDNVKLMEDTCDILNRVFTKGKDMETMMEKLKDYKKEQKLNQEREIRIGDIHIRIGNKDDCTSATTEDKIGSGVCLIL